MNNSDFFFIWKNKIKKHIGPKYHSCPVGGARDKAVGH